VLIALLHIAAGYAYNACTKARKCKSRGITTSNVELAGFTYEVHTNIPTLGSLQIASFGWYFGVEWAFTASQ